MAMAGSQNFMSFGGGSRLRAGAEFSKLQMAIFLHHLVAKYRWRVIRGGEIIRLPAVIFPKKVSTFKYWRRISKSTTKAEYPNDI
nr:cytochrome P450 87A3-like [Populus alba]